MQDNAAQSKNIERGMLVSCGELEVKGEEEEIMSCNTNRLLDDKLPDEDAVGSEMILDIPLAPSGSGIDNGTRDGSGSGNGSGKVAVSSLSTIFSIKGNGKGETASPTPTPTPTPTPKPKPNSTPTPTPTPTPGPGPGPGQEKEKSDKGSE